MTELKLLLAGLIAATRLATAVIAWKHHLNARQVAKDVNASATSGWR